MAQILVLLKYTVTWRMEVAMSILKHQKPVSYTHLRAHET